MTYERTLNIDSLEELHEHLKGLRLGAPDEALPALREASMIVLKRSKNKTDAEVKSWWGDCWGELNDNLRKAVRKLGKDPDHYPLPTDLTVDAWRDTMKAIGAYRTKDGIKERNTKPGTPGGFE